MKKLSIIMLSMTLFIVSCSEEDESTLSTEDARATMISVSQNIESDIVDMIESDGVESLSSLQDIFDIVSYDESLRSTQGGRNAVQNTVKEIIKIRNVFAPKQRTQYGEVTIESIGVYAWDADLQQFELLDAEVNYLELQYPAEGSTTNNAVLTVNEFATEELDGTLNLTSVNADLVLDDVLVVSVDLDLDIDSEGMIQQANLDLFVAPFDYHLELKDDLPLESSIAASINKDDLLIMSVDLTMGYTDVEKFDVNIIEGEVNYREIGIIGGIDMTGLDFDSEEEIDVNDHVDLMLMINGEKLGDIVVKETPDEIDLLVVYNDGTSESLLDLMEPTVFEVEQLLEEVDL
ncbi:MAG: hypothetical protein OCD76_00650 [Reichenbachiella sp.]